MTNKKKEEDKKGFMARYLINEDVYKKFDEKCKNNGVTKAEIVRRKIEEYLKEND